MSVHIRVNAPQHNKHKGFTLVELSIVIVIIGLIITGITAGQSLVKSARLRAIVTNKEMYVSAMNAFKMQYNGLAGDITNATSYWPGGLPNGANADGNGDGIINAGQNTWQQLRLAGLINNGNYNSAGASPGVVGVNWGVSGYSSTVGFNVITFGYGSNGWGYGTTAVYGRTGNIVFALGTIYGGGYSVAASALTPNDALGIDTKIDDALPNKGAVMSDNGLDTGISTCRTGVASAINVALGTAVSYLNNDTVGCRMMFVYK